MVMRGPKPMRLDYLMDLGENLVLCHIMTQNITRKIPFPHCAFSYSKRSFSRYIRQIPAQNEITEGEILHILSEIVI
jgi:hypothetical protein